MKKPIINKTELLEIAKAAETKRATKKQEEAKAAKEDRKKERAAVKKRVDKIIASIPEALKEASKDSIKVENGRVVIAKIFIVGEQMFSVMCNKGCLSDFDIKVLKTTRQRMKTLRIEGVELSEKQVKEPHTFSDGDSSSSGDCIEYYIIARTVLE